MQSNNRPTIRAVLLRPAARETVLRPAARETVLRPAGREDVLRPVARVAPFRPVARVAGWLLPWLVLLTISASAAYGMTVAAGGPEAAAGRDQTASTTLDGSLRREGCDTTDAWLEQNAIDSGWMPARNARCGAQRGSPR